MKQHDVVNVYDPEPPSEKTNSINNKKQKTTNLFDKVLHSCL